jgi:hypothetical protein
VGFDEFEEKRKKSIADILMGTGKGGLGVAGSTPRIISVYYPNADPRASQQSLKPEKTGGIMRKSFKKGQKIRSSTIKKKVRFTDEVGKDGQIATIYEVESFATNTKSLRDKNDENFHCNCIIF